MNKIIDNFMIALGNWIIFCGLIKLLTLCFALKYNWGVTSIIWGCTYILRPNAQEGE